MTLDYGTVSRAAELVDRLTRSGENGDADSCKLVEIENICKKSPAYVGRVHALLFHRLKEKHSQIRLNALRVCNRLFKEFEHFRRLVIVDFSVLIALTVNTDTERPLPPPKRFAADLELYAIRCVKEWRDQFGKVFKDEFDFVVKYLSKYKKIDFESMTVRSVAEARRLEEREQRQRRLNEEKLQKIEFHVNELEPEITIAASTLNSCLELLIPTPEEFSIPAAEEDDGPSNGTAKKKKKRTDRVIGSDDEGKNAGGNGQEETGVTVELRPDYRIRVKKTEDNSAVIESANEQVKLISNKYLPKIKKWLQDVAKISDGDLLKRTIEIKRRLTDLLDRENKIAYYEDDCSADDDDSDMEEVPPVAADDLLAKTFDDGGGNTGAAADEVSGRGENNPPGGGGGNNVVVDVPKLPFDVDLYHWEDERISAPRILPTNQDGHSFWTSNSIMDTDCDGIVQPEGAASLRTRVIEFTGKFERVDRQCRVPLPSGRLCPREDRFKCPFHGLIVSRDELGRAVDKDKNPIPENEKRPPSVPDWQDPQLLRDIRRETGVDLTMPEKGGRKKRKNRYSTLQDLKKELDTPRSRLEKKVFKKSSVKKVAKILDGMDQRKFRDKFGDQFNYVHDTA